MGLLNNKIVFLRTISFDPETGEEIKKIKHFYQKKDNQKIDCVQENDHRTNECKFIIYKSDCKTVSVNRLKK
ncbi:DUF2963 domain-containing protein [Candidatus Phytoplasma australiense]|nr:hypothetical protein [Candidatus Phytoplasma australiense]